MKQIMTTFHRKRILTSAVRVSLSCLLLTAALLTSAATRSARLPVAGKWERFEVKLKSDVVYTNPLHQAEINGIFVSPNGQRFVVPGFWDGGKTWRVRFSPGVPGKWIYRIVCTDTANKGLHDQKGEFICTAPTGKTRFGQHGPVRVALDRKHLEHVDFTPFFWVGDAAWDAGRMATPKDWQSYSLVRSSQKFNAVQWTLAPGKDFKDETAYTGREQIAINLEFFRRMEDKIMLLNRKGVLSAIAPLWEIGVSGDDLLPDTQAAELLRYAVARWGAEDVAWILAFEGDDAGKKAERWKRIGRVVFGDINHAPVMLLPGETHWLMDEFREEKWMDVLGCQTSRVLDEDSLQWMLTGPLTLERRKEPSHPIITLAPPAENAPTKEAGKLLDSDRTRRLLWWSALVNTPAGVSYSAHGVAHWDTAVGARNEHERSDMPVWQKELFLPGARDIEALGDFFTKVGFWRLEPFPRAIPNQPGIESPRRYIAAGGTEAGDLLVAYIPEDREANIAVGAFPRSPAMTWVNPRNGKPSSTAAVPAGKVLQFPTPEAGRLGVGIESREVAHHA
jgi:hypothetical protein